jgi:hypothetical protein
MNRRLDKASSAVLIAWILVATAIVAFYVTLAMNGRFGVRIIYFAFVLIWPVMCIVTAWMLDESDHPLIDIHDDGIDISPVFSNGARIPWGAFNKMSVVHWYYNYVFRVPFMSWVVVSLHDSRYIAPHLRWMPTSWFGRILIPIRFAKGGAFAAKLVISNANDRVITGRLDPAHRPPTLSDPAASADAAIARALAMRGNSGSAQPQARTIADSYDSEATQSAPVPSPVREPMRSDPLPEYRPARPAEPIIVNGVPYHPNRPTIGGFGRKRG